MRESHRAPVVEGGVAAGDEAQYLVFGGPGDESGRVVGYVSHAEPGGRWARFIEGGEGGGSSPAAGIAGGADGADFGRVLGFRRQAGHGEGGACSPVVEGGVAAGDEAQYLVFGGPGDESGRVVGYRRRIRPSRGLCLARRARRALGKVRKIGLRLAHMPSICKP